MKTVSKYLILLICVLCLSSCNKTYIWDSLDEYKQHVEKHGSGFSIKEIDDPNRFIPSPHFLNDYEYIEGKYYYYESGFFNFDGINYSFLVLKYNEDIYEEAKKDMLEKIPNHIENKYYYYNDYTFYENENYVLFNDGVSYFPKKFTMACYNDTNCSLMFIGFLLTYSDISLNTNDEFVSFIDKYYGNLYDFNI